MINLLIILTLFTNSLWAYDYNDNDVTVDLHKKLLNDTFDFELSLFNNKKCSELPLKKDQLDQETFKQVEIELNTLRDDVVQCAEAPNYAKFYLAEYVKLEKHYVNQNNILKKYIQKKLSLNNVDQVDNFVPKFWSNLSSASMTLHKVRLSIDVLNDADEKGHPECLAIITKKNMSPKYCKPICKLTLTKRIKYLEALKKLKPLVKQYWKDSWCKALLDKIKFDKVKKDQVFKVVGQSGEPEDYFYKRATPSIYKGGAEIIKNDIHGIKKNQKPIGTMTMPKYESKSKKTRSRYYNLTRESYYNRLKTIERAEKKGEKSIWRTISERYYKDFYPHFIRDNSKDIFSTED
jgi:hypothetical protein